MKQHITKEQWDELSDEQHISFDLGLRTLRKSQDLPSIGQMIEFLGDDMVQMSNFCNSWLVDASDEFKIKDSKELVDALWEAVKEKCK